MSRRRWAIVFLVVLCVQGLARAAADASLFEPGRFNAKFDFFMCWASVRALNDGLPDIYGQAMAQYESALSGGRWANPDNHPPPFYLMFMPQARMPFDVGFWVHNAVSIALFVVALCMLARLLWAGPLAGNAGDAAGRASGPGREGNHGSEDSGRRGSGIGVALALALGIMLSGIGFDSVLLGQVDLAAFFLLTCMLVASLRGRSVLAGACLGVAILMKGFPVFLMIWLGVRREWKAMAAAVVAPLLLCGVALAVWGAADFRAYFEHNREASYYMLILNQSFMGWLVMHVDRSMTLPQLKIIQAGVSVLCLWPIVRVGLRRRERSPLEATVEVAAYLLAAMFCAAFSWGHHHVMVAFLMMALLGAAFGVPEGERIGTPWLVVMLVILWLYFTIEGESTAALWDVGVGYYKNYGPLLMLAVLMGLTDSLLSCVLVRD